MQSIRPVLKQFRLGRRSSSSGSVFLGAVQGFWERMSSLGGLMGMLRRARADGREPLFISLADVHPDRKLPALSPIKITGPYSTYHELRKTHLDLLSEDFRRALSEQINEIRGNPKLLESTFHYVVTGDRVMLTQKYGRRGRHQIGVKMSFDSNKYRHVRWDEEKRFLSGNLVFLSKDGMKTFHVGLVHDSHPHFLRRGHVVIKMISGTDGKYFQMLDQQSFVGSTYHLVESAVFYFPYLHVTNALREDRDSRLFFEEIVRGQPSKPPMYMSALSYVEQVHFDHLRDSLIQGLNESQANAFKSVLKHRVALVQGPPGTGKTYLGCKVAEFFVSLKKKCPSLFSGPLLVVTTTNHAVDEFLSRCLVFTDKLVHAYSDKHTRSHHGALQEKYDEDPTHDGKGAIMRRADIVAMTTTRAAYVRSTLDDLEIKIVIVEEAAEALEAYVLASIPQNIQHLIQIGDHKQLQPSCSHHALASSHNLNLSLFERLLNNGLECVMLNEQRRMRPSIKKLVENIYPNLTNHPCTEERPRVKGVDLEVPVFFINKTEPEKQEGKSYSNVEEAAMAAELAAYLLRQGYDVGKITVLTTYKRQLSLVLKNLRRIGDGAQNIRATCVDNFQGEENDIIILSLVRSNAWGAIGFLQKENRACVALSRAKTGFFILGNVSCLTASGSTTWQHVKDELSSAGRLGPALPLVCPHGRKFLGVSAADIREAGEGCAVCRLDTALSEAEKLTQKVAIELEKTEKALVAVTRDVDNMLLDQEARDAAKNAMEAELVKKTRLVDELSARRLEDEELRKKCRTAAALLERGRIDVATETVESLEEKVKGYQAELLPEVLGRLSVA